MEKVKLSERPSWYPKEDTKTESTDLSSSWKVGSVFREGGNGNPWEIVVASGGALGGSWIKSKTEAGEIRFRSFWHQGDYRPRARVVQTW
jgi:hypothetical protein